MKDKLVTLGLITVLATPSVFAQFKKPREGFGFGRKQESHVSSALFPEGDPSSSQGSSGSIFKSGQPRETNATSYVIENGERVEREIKVQQKKESFFGFGKKKAQAKPAESTDSTPSSTAANEATAARPASEIPIVAEAIAGAPEKETKKSGGFLGFGKKKKAETPVVAAPAPPVEVAAPVEAATTAPVETAPVAQDDIPEFAGSESSSANGSGSLISKLNPLSKSAPEKKPVSLAGAETIIENGKIVARDEEVAPVPAAPASEGASSSAPPRVVNGVTTYSSWDDIDARSYSAAEKILKGIR